MFVRRDLTDTVSTPSGNMHFIKKGSGYPRGIASPGWYVGLGLGECSRNSEPKLHLLRLRHDGAR